VQTNILEENIHIEEKTNVSRALRLAEGRGATRTRPSAIVSVMIADGSPSGILPVMIADGQCTPGARYQRERRTRTALLTPLRSRTAPHERAGPWEDCSSKGR